MGFARRAIEQPGLGLYWYGLKLHKQEEDDDDEEEEEGGGNGGITAGKGRGSVRLRNAIGSGLGIRCAPPTRTG